MQKLPAETMTRIKSSVKQMKDNRRPAWNMWREVASTYLPYTHPWLLNPNNNEQVKLNPNYITSVGLMAARTSTAGLMNGITSPTRPWFKASIGVDESLLSWGSRQWLRQATQIMFSVLARSNFYNTMSMGYFDLNLFNITGSEVFEDKDTVFRMQRYNTGEFYVLYDEFGRVAKYGREFKMTLLDAKNRFGEKNLPAAWREQLNNPQSLNTKKLITHFAERSSSSSPFRHPADRRPWRQVYYTKDETTENGVLEISGLREQAATFPRWSSELVMGNSPALDALADMRELQQILLQKGIGLEKTVDPPMLFDQSLRNEPRSSLPGGETFVRNLAEAGGARELYSARVPFQELRLDINDLKISIQEIFHNDLFKMISQLDTVRSATEIDARREEKLVLLAHFLERFENDQLDPTLNRIFNMCLRAGVFPDPPKELLDIELNFEYVSILASAQRAISTVPTERLLQIVGNVAAMEPNVLDIVNFDELIYTYGSDVGAHPIILRDAQQLKARREQREQANAALEATATAQTAIEGAKTLSETEVGGGANALQRMLS